ncbi:DUF4435 domain-containing protein [Qipengyuania sp. NPDC077410]|uniref:DUF4435 domain-containing protein n=1 Tax=Qipengyuania sp. NPDC077410 TaxID=3364496 RepID=UPI0037C71927
MEDVLVRRLKAKKDSLAVTQLQLLKFRSVSGTAPIFVFEGVTDRRVWGQWIFRADHNLKYEPYVCDGKREARKISKVLKRLVGNAGQFRIFVDRDFDDLDGFEAKEYCFYTDRYSIENYLVSGDLIERILRDDFGCGGKPALRQTIADQLAIDFKAFIELMAQINCRLYVAKKCNISRVAILPKGLNEVIDIDFSAVTPKNYRLEVQVDLYREPSFMAAKYLEAEFGQLDGTIRYRGKFVAQFLTKWFEGLFSRFRDNRTPFSENADINARNPEINIALLASRSDMPEGLHAFLDAI